MPVFPSQDLYAQKICESYQKLLQIYSGSIVLDGSGSQKQFLDITASYVLHGGGTGTTLNTGSYYPITSSWAINSITASYALNAGTTIYTGSYYPITSSWAINSINSITASYALNCGCEADVTQSFYNQSIWNFTHSLEQKDVILQTYNEFNELILPNTTKLIDDNHARFIFPVPVTGFAIAVRTGLRIVTRNFKPTTGSFYPITSSWAVNAVTASYVNTSNVKYSIKTINTNYTVNLTDYTILCNAGAGHLNVKLPAASATYEKIFNIKKIDLTGHNIHVTTTNGDYIDFDITQSIAHKGTNMSVHSDGTRYWIL